MAVSRSRSPHASRGPPVPSRALSGRRTNRYGPEKQYACKATRLRHAAENIPTEGTMRMAHVGAAALFGLSGLLLAGATQAGEITVMVSPAFREAYVELVPAFERATENKVVTLWVGNGAIITRLKGGETVDLAILSEDGIDELAKLGKVAPGVPLGKSPIGVAVRAGAPKPDISSGEAVKRALLAAKSVALSTGPSGVYLSGVIQKWGIADELKPKLAS